MEHTGQNRLLVVVDMQNDFIDGALGTQEAVGIVADVQEKIREKRGEGWTILFTRDTHGGDYLSTQEGRKLPVIHCVMGTEGWQIRDGLREDTDPVIDKPTFGSMTLVKYCEMTQPQEIELVGLCTDICVISNAMLLKAALPEVPIRVCARCCAGVTPQSHRTALEAMKACQIEII